MAVDQFGQIWIYSKSPFDNAYGNVIKFNSKQEMESFFYTSSLLNEIYYNNTCTWIRKEGNIQVEGNQANFENASYMRFENEKGRMYYAFIIDTHYTNENTTQIIFEIDVWNTYQLELLSDNIQGFVEQASMKKFNPDGTKNIIQIDQGFNVGSLLPYEITALNLNIDWLVIVAKPSIQLNAQDNRVGSPGLPGTFKAFRYFVIPCDLINDKTYSFKFGALTVKSQSISSLVKGFSNLFYMDGDVNTVNQVVNMYTTKYCGLNFTLENGVIVIDDFGEGKIQSIGGTGSSSDGSVNSGITGGNMDSVVSWDVELDYLGGTLSAHFLKRVILWCRAFKILPELLLCQIAHESVWGTSYLARTDNNYSGITAWWSSGTEYNKTVDITMSLGSARPPSEGGNYVHFSVAEDWIAYHCYLISGFPANSGNKTFITMGVSDLETAINGLFIAGGTGAKADYAADGLTLYKSALLSHDSAMRIAFGPQIDAMNALVYNNGEWLTSDPEINNAGLNSLQNNLGSYVGNKECYAVAALYSRELGGPSLEAGISYPGKSWLEGSKQGADTRSASQIGDAYKWEDYGFSVDYEPLSFNQLRIGDIICWKGYSQSIYSSSKQWGHVAVIFDVDYEKELVSFYHQWNSSGGILAYENVNADLNGARSIVHAPGSPIHNGSGGSSGSLINSNVTGISALEIITLKEFKKYEVMTIDCKNILEKAFRESLGQNADIESQLFSSEFSSIKMLDSYGSSYKFNPEFIPDGDNNIIITGCVGDSNHTHYTIEDYKIEFDPGNDSFKRVQPLYFGLTDSNPRSLTILSDASDTFFQANNNTYQAQQKSFNENAQTLALNESLSVKQTDLANRESTYNSNYAIDSAKFGLVQTTIGAALGLGGSLITGNLLGVASGLTSGGFGIANSYRNLQNQNQQGEFNTERNSLREESNSLANMQAKLSLNQSIRAYNAGIKDLENQPVSVLQAGTDLSFQGGNRIDDIYISFEIPNNIILENANKYIRNYGVVVNKWVDDIREIFDNRELYNYIKCADLELRNIGMNQSHFNALRAVFLTGVRIWNYNQNIDSTYLRLELPNNDK